MTISSKAAPATPLYANMVTEINALGLSHNDTPLAQLREFCNQPVPLPQGIDMPLVAPLKKKIIATTADNSSGTVTLTLVRPKGSESQHLPVAIFLHGGGWAVGSFMNHEKFIKDVVVQANTVVIYVEYSLSPEVKYPVAIEECYDTILWVKENAASIHVDSSQMTVFGDSSGGNLAAAVSILLKQRDHGNVLKKQILIYPLVAHNHDQYASFQLYGQPGDYALSSDQVRYASNLYHDPKYKTKNDHGGYNYGPPDHILHAPLLATTQQLAGLPPCLVITAECDVLCDESEQYARQLTAAGVATSAVRLVGAVHGFMTSTDVYTPQYRYGLQVLADFLKQ